MAGYPVPKSDWIFVILSISIVCRITNSRSISPLTYAPSPHTYHTPKRPPSDPSKLELYNKAIHHYQLAVQADPRDVSSLLGLAQLLVDVDRRAGPVGTGDPEQSLNNSSNSNNSNNNNNNNNNNEERVISLLEQICAVEPHHPEASYRLAMIRSQSHLTDISIEIGAAPREYVRGLFDYYANTGTYDEHLVKQLE